MPITPVQGLKVYHVHHSPALPSLPPVVFIHGAGGTHQHWLYQVRDLPHSPTYALDLPGHGRSLGPGRDRVQVLWAQPRHTHLRDPRKRIAEHPEVSVRPGLLRRPLDGRRTVAPLRRGEGVKRSRGAARAPDADSQHPYDDAFWQAREPGAKASRIDVPVFGCFSWQDDEVSSRGSTFLSGLDPARLRRERQHPQGRRELHRYQPVALPAER